MRTARTTVVAGLLLALLTLTAPAARGAQAAEPGRPSASGVPASGDDTIRVDRQDLLLLLTAVAIAAVVLNAASVHRARAARTARRKDTP